ncbi:MAG: DUF917 domain-containing protein [Candidatus Bathyarchaeales archaeon]
MLKLDEQQIEDLLVGAKILGTGGGGEIEWVRPLIQEVFDKGKEFVLVDPKEAPDDEIIVIAGRVGGGITAEEAKFVEGYKTVYERPELIAVKELGRYLGKSLYALIPSEIGAGNTLAPMYVAAMLDKVTIDGDACGRAKPEISISTTNIAGIPAAPLCLVTRFGDTMFVTKTVDDFRAEQICRSVAASSGGMVGVCRSHMLGKDMRKAIVPNSITRTILIGRQIREAREKGKDPIEAFIKAVNGFEVFAGEVSTFRREERGSFMWGDIIINGKEKYKGHTLKVFFKNEHLISWLDGKPFVTCPDLICIVDAETAFGLSNWKNDFTKGRNVVVVGIPAHPIWRTEKGLKLFGPTHFGYDISYTPLEEIIGKIAKL